MLTHTTLVLGLLATPVPVDPIPVENVLTHLRAFQATADTHGGSRVAGRPGHDASARYVAARLREAGYTVELQPFTFDFYREVAPAALSGRHRFRGVSTMHFSGSGDVTGRPRRAGLGCAEQDYRRFVRGRIAVVRRGSCSFEVKAQQAVKAGATALIVVDQKGPFKGNANRPQPIPVLAVGKEVGARVAGLRRVRVVTRTESETRRTYNVIAQTPGARPDGKVVMVGAHLDSRFEGPGINDNGTGAAAILELALRMAGARPATAVRFAWWSAEEEGLYGSKHYVAKLTPQERQSIEVYLNVDMIGSRNHTYGVYKGASERFFARYFSRLHLPYHTADLNGASDYAPFSDADVQVGGLFTGGKEAKTKAEAILYGGTAGKPKDPCYHKACDTMANVDHEVLAVSTGAIAEVVARYVSCAPCRVN
ncbi:M28 family peptidase [Nonomuraea rhizosphaerae]|uniref:M28 family peptidase n=1 Tax=Nonomuraea rhizosphaerae TaxID=2665663 RepID=UPI001C5E3172|nr:M28 family peptidase [Nonomuraea rhizosphaerae]